MSPICGSRVYIGGGAMAPGPSATVILSVAPINMPFRFNAKNAFLTYPQCPLSPEAVGKHLLELRPALYVHVVRETHQDGNYHIHALVQWPNKYNVRNDRVFDIAGHHPNIQSPRDVVDVEDYISKTLDGNGTSETEFVHGQFAGKKNDQLWRRVAEATTESEVMQAALEASPRDYVLYHDKLREYAKSKGRHVATYVPPPGQLFTLPDSLATYMIREFTQPVGLCPWILREAHSFSDHKGGRIVLKPCCSSVQPELARPSGQDHSVLTYTGGVCLTSRHSPPRQTTSLRTI